MFLGQHPNAGQNIQQTWIYYCISSNIFHEAEIHHVQGTTNEISAARNNFNINEIIKEKNYPKLTSY